MTSDLKAPSMKSSPTFVKAPAHKPLFDGRRSERTVVMSSSVSMCPFSGPQSTVRTQYYEYGSTFVAKHWPKPFYGFFF